MVLTQVIITHQCYVMVIVAVGEVRMDPEPFHPCPVYLNLLVLTPVIITHHHLQILHPLPPPIFSLQAVSSSEYPATTDQCSPTEWFVCPPVPQPHLPGDRGGGAVITVRADNTGCYCIITTFTSIVIFILLWFIIIIFCVFMSDYLTRSPRVILCILKFIKRLKNNFNKIISRKL